MTQARLECDTAGELRLAVEAMATRFELVLSGADERRLRSAGEEALSEIVRLDRQLSAYSPSSEISWINARAAHGPVRVEARLFRLLQRCQALSADTDEAFDITVGPLMRAWGLVGEGGAVPDDTTRAAAHASVGSAHLRLDPKTSTVAFGKAGMSIDLGAAGKGYAIDQAIDILHEHGVPGALLHGGTSSVHVIGSSSDASIRRIAWSPPGAETHTFSLRDGALSVSAVHGKSFLADGREYGHVMDPRRGAPTHAAQAAAVTGPHSLECDALSTALLVLGPAWLPALQRRFPGYDGYLAGQVAKLNGMPNVLNTGVQLRAR